MHDVEVTMVKKENHTNGEVEVDTGDAGGSEAKSTPMFTCPAHFCWTCTQKDAREKEENESCKISNSKKKKRKKQSIFQCKTETRVFVSSPYWIWTGVIMNSSLTCLSPFSALFILPFFVSCILYSSNVALSWTRSLVSWSRFHSQTPRPGPFHFDAECGGEQHRQENPKNGRVQKISAQVRSVLQPFLSWVKGGSSWKSRKVFFRVSREKWGIWVRQEYNKPSSVLLALRRQGWGACETCSLHAYPLPAIWP